jgi:tRNA modification GTPase
MLRPQTIIAVATAAGVRAPVAIVRLSGPNAGPVLQALSTSSLPPARQAVVRKLKASSQEIIDEALVLWMPGPNSLTGEDVVELQVHGGLAVIEAVIAAALATGQVRPAEPGEFSRRAFEAGKLDLTQAEAVADLIDAETEAQRRQALRVYEGAAGIELGAWREKLVGMMAALEASIDFADEGDVPNDVAKGLDRDISILLARIDGALADAARLRAVREGFRVAILGPPNAGKSSLLNRLARREAAIVSPIPGTTRDVVEVRVVIAGAPVWIADTAGLREASDAIEAEGVRRALARAEDADLRLWVFDAAERVVPRETEVARQPGDLTVWNKADLAPPPDASGLPVSAWTGEGFDDLERRLEDIVRSRLAAVDVPLVTRARHAALLQEARLHLMQAQAALSEHRPPELVAEDLRLAARAVGRVVGDVGVEDLLDRIFADFCIGK